MQPVWRARIAALVLALGGLLAGLLGQFAAGTVLIAGAAAVVMLVQDRGVSLETARGLAQGPAATVDDVADAMHLAGDPVFLPGGQMFLPAETIEAKDAPVWDGATRLQRHAPAVGLIVTSPGAGLWEAYVDYDTLPRQGIEGAAGALRKALPALGIGQNVRVERAESGARVTWQATGPLESSMRSPDTAFVGMVLAAALGRPVALHRITGSTAVVTEWSW